MITISQGQLQELNGMYTDSMKMLEHWKQSWNGEVGNFEHRMIIRYEETVMTLEIVAQILGTKGRTIV